MRVFQLQHPQWLPGPSNELLTLLPCYTDMQCCEVHARTSWGFEKVWCHCGTDWVGAVHVHDPWPRGHGSDQAHVSKSQNGKRCHTCCSTSISRTPGYGMASWSSMWWNTFLSSSSCTGHGSTAAQWSTSTITPGAVSWAALTTATRWINRSSVHRACHACKWCDGHYCNWCQTICVIGCHTDMHAFDCNQCLKLCVIQLQLRL